MRLAPVPENWLERIALHLGLAPTPILDTLVALLLAKSVVAANSVGIFDAIAGGELTSEEISERCRTRPAPTSKLLTALYACGYLKLKRGRYRLSLVSQRWLTGEHPKSLRAAMLLRNIDLRFMNFEDYVRDGITQEMHTRLSASDWITYREGQASHAALLVEEIVRHAPAPASAVDMLDLGGGHGLYSLSFCAHYPMLRARVLDLDIQTERHKPDPNHPGPHDRVRFERADIRSVQFPEASADIVLFANLAHHFDESTNRKVVQCAATALRRGGVLIFVDAVRSAATEEAGQIESLLDLYFGAASGSGVWTLEAIKSWFEEGGLNCLSAITLRLVPCWKMLVGVKNQGV